MARTIRSKNVVATYDIDDMIAKYKESIETDVTDRLVIYAKEKIQKAYLNRTFQNQTYNLKDSYVWVVYLNGVTRDYGFIDSTPKATEAQYEDEVAIIGRDEAESFIAYYQPRIYNGWELVIAVTAIYGQYLEEGSGGRGKYVVISSIFDDLAKDFGSANVKTFNL